MGNTNGIAKETPRHILCTECRVQKDWWVVWGSNNSNTLTAHLLDVQKTAMKKREI